MTDSLIRPKVPAFQPSLEPWDGGKRRPTDPGTRNKQPPRVRLRSFDSGDRYQSHEDRLRAKIGGGQ